MACSSTWDRETKAPEGIAGDRRVDRRYPLLLDLRWKLIHRKRVLDTGEGSTLDFSSGGVRFESGRTLPEGFDVELAIRWPVLLHNVAPMQLVVQGRIVRSRDGEIAVRMVQHEFRTVGMPAHHSDAPTKAADTGTPFLTAVNGGARFAKLQ
jgi:hypothetical protein